MTTPDSTPRRTTARRWQLQIVTTLALAFAATAGPALAATHFAAPTGAAANWPCTTASQPCDLKTAIQGTGSSSPASGDQVILENNGHDFALTNENIVAPVAEDIHGAAGQIIQVNASGVSSGPFLKLGAFSQPSELDNVQIYENGATSTSAVEAPSDTILDDDLIASSAFQGISVLLGAGDKLLDTVADATGTEGLAVGAEAPNGGTVTLRNVTAYAASSNSEAIETASTSCSSTPLVVSLRNVIAYGSRAAIDGASRCTTSGVVNIDIDYSDFNPAGVTLAPNVTINEGTHNINQPALFVNAAADDFHESPGSPTIDAGTSDAQDGAFDPDGRPRFLGRAPDMGAYEFRAAYPVTGNATNLSTTGATLNGTVDSEGSNLTTTYDFQYGTSTSYGSFSPNPLGHEPGSTVFPNPQAVSVPLTGLHPGTTYDYRLVADNSDGRTFGANHTFTTEAPATLKIVFARTGHGTVTSSPNIGACATTCTLSGLTETPYTLTPTAPSGSSFAGWSGGGCSGTGPCTIDLSAATTITATFTKSGGEHGASHKPTLSRFSLTGLATHKPKLSFTVTKGTGAPALKTLVMTLPNDLKFKTAKHGIKLSSKAKLKLRHGTLTITLKHAATSVKLTFGDRAISVQKTKHKHLTLVIHVTDTAGTATKLVQRA